MRRVILWIVAISITFALGTGADTLKRYLFTKKPPAVAKVETAQAEVAATVVETPTPTPQATMILDYNTEKYSRNGVLSIMGPVPKGFSDFVCIEMTVDSGGHVDYPGYLELYSREDVGYTHFVLVTERTLYFTTSPRQEDGIQYRFEGEFLIKDFNSVIDKNKAAVRGTLTKSRKGRTLAEQTITFRVESFGC